MTPLHLCAKNYVEMAFLLLDHGADLYAPTKDKKTPLDHVKKEADKEKLRNYLKNKGKSAPDREAQLKEEEAHRRREAEKEKQEAARLER